MKSLSLIDRAFLLKGTPLFGALDLDLLLTIADKLELIRYKENDFIFQPDQEASLMYLIVEGSIEIYDREKEKSPSLQKGISLGMNLFLANKTEDMALNVQWLHPY